jgi:hypothetical protein
MHLIETVIKNIKYIYANECIYHRETGKSNNISKCIGKINANKDFIPNKFMKQILLLNFRSRFSGHKGLI